MEHPEFGEKCVDHIQRCREGMNTHIRVAGSKEQERFQKHFLPVLQRIFHPKVYHTHAREPYSTADFKIHKHKDVGYNERLWGRI